MKKWRNRFITLFVILWCVAFHYESVRHFYLNPLFDQQLPKIKFLFPPAGWIIFFRVGDSYGHIRIFGIKKDQNYEIDPHEVFRVRTIGYDNIHRGVIGSAASQRNKRSFCQHLIKRFNYYEDFIVAYEYYPDFIAEPHERIQQLLYSCKEQGR